MKYLLLAIVLAFSLSGGPTSMVEEEVIYMRSWVIPMDWGCEVDMPHGLKRCANGNLDGSTVYMSGY